MEFVPLRGTNYARSRLQKMSESPERGFSTVCGGSGLPEPPEKYYWAVSFRQAAASSRRVLQGTMVQTAATA